MKVVIATYNAVTKLKSKVDPIPKVATTSQVLLHKIIKIVIMK
jgi:hypothetical protein